LRRATDKTKLEYLESKCDKITEMQRTGRYGLMYRKAKELDRKENNGIRTVGIEDSQGHMIVDQNQVLKIWEIYVEELYDRANRPEKLNVEPEEVGEDYKGPHILSSEMEKAIKEMRDKKATGDDDVPVEALRLLGDGGLNLLTQLINNIYESGE
jgi:glycosylphosphatidylinositol transamidase (GPIT) subunit GPI8